MILAAAPAPVNADDDRDPSVIPADGQPCDPADDDDPTDYAGHDEPAESDVAWWAESSARLAAIRDTLEQLNDFRASGEWDRMTADLFADADAEAGAYDELIDELQAEREAEDLYCRGLVFA